MLGLKQYRHPKTGILYPPPRDRHALAVRTGHARLPGRTGCPERHHSGPSGRAYKDTAPWTDLAKRTKSDYEKVIGFLKPLYDLPVHTLTVPRIVELLDKWRKKRGRSFVNYCLTLLTLLMIRGVELGLINENPADQVKRVKRDKNVAPLNRPWSEEERLAVRERTATRAISTWPCL